MPHELAFPVVDPVPPRYWEPVRTGCTSWGGESKWLSIIGVGKDGTEQALAKPPERGQTAQIRAAMLQVPGLDEAICFAVDRPQPARFDGTRIRISINPGDTLWFGLCRPEDY